MKKSEILRIIREEVEVILTNNEAVEIFDLDPVSLLDKMMSETESDSGSDFLKSKGHDPETAAPFKGTKTKRGAAKRQRRKEKPAGEEIEDLEETEDKSFSKAGEEIKEKGTEGVFTAKAKKAGMGVQACKASTKTKRQAAFAKGAATVARENK